MYVGFAALIDWQYNSVVVFHLKINRLERLLVESYRPLYNFVCDKELEKLFADYKKIL